jgi:hypothetical protein
MTAALLHGAHNSGRLRRLTDCNISVTFRSVRSCSKVTESFSNIRDHSEALFTWSCLVLIVSPLTFTSRNSGLLFGPHSTRVYNILSRGKGSNSFELCNEWISTALSGFNVEYRANGIVLTSFAGHTKFRTTTQSALWNQQATTQHSSLRACPPWLWCRTFDGAIIHVTNGRTFCCAVTYYERGNGERGNWRRQCP